MYFISVTRSRLGRDAAPLISRLRFARRNIRVGVTLQSQISKYIINLFSNAQAERDSCKYLGYQIKYSKVDRSGDKVIGID